MTEQQQRKCEHVVTMPSGNTWVCVRPWHGARRQVDNHVMVSTCTCPPGSPLHFDSTACQA